MLLGQRGHGVNVARVNLLGDEARVAQRGDEVGGALRS